MKIELRDPNKLRPHKLHRHLPEPDETTPEWHSFSDNLQSNGPEKCPPIIVTDHGFVMDGWRRVLVARTRQWETIACQVRPDDEAALYMVESLFGQPDMPRGNKLYFTLPLLPDYVAASERRRLSNKVQKRETNEIPLILPECSDCTLDPNQVAVWDVLGVSRRTFFQAQQIRALLHNPESDRLAELAGLKPGSKAVADLQISLRSEYERQLYSGEKSLWYVHSAICGRLTTEDKERDTGDTKRLEFWTTRLHPLISASHKWTKIPSEVRQRVRNDVVTLLKHMTPEEQTDIAERLRQ